MCSPARVVESLAMLLFANESISLVAFVTFLPKSLNRLIAFVLPSCNPEEVGFDAIPDKVGARPPVAEDALEEVAAAASVTWRLGL
jgi:hypothetical protein